MQYASGRTVNLNGHYNVNDHSLRDAAREYNGGTADDKAKQRILGDLAVEVFAMLRVYR
jgi:hypothetical protein